jgi:Glycosyltransferase family 87
MAVVTDGGDIARVGAGWARSPRWRGAFALPRTVLEAVSFVLLPLTGPAMVGAYLIGAYHPRPGVLEGKYYPDGGFLFDLHTMWQAGHDVVTLHSPYPFVYPAPAALVMAPFGALPWTAAVVAFTLTLLGGLFFTLRLLGVRDWRCYALALAAMPMASSIMVGTPTPLLALGAAVAWRYRDRRWVTAAAIVGVVVTKIFLWPLWFWLVATRRYRTAATTAVLGIVVLFGSWGVLGFSGLRDYPSRLGNIAGLEQDKSYSPFALFRSLGLSTGSTRLAVLGLTVVAIAAIFAASRFSRDGDRLSFVVALITGLLASPIVWLHYLVLLIVPLALYRPRLSTAWFIPLAYWFLPGQESHGSVRNILVMFGLTTLTLALAVRRGRAPKLVPALSSP